MCASRRRVARRRHRPHEAALRALAAGTKTTFHGYIDDSAVNALAGDARAVILRVKKISASFRSRPPPPERRRSRYAPAARSKQSSRAKTGAFFNDPNDDSLAAAITAFDRSRYTPQILRAHAEAFAPPRFIERLKAIVEEVRAAVIPSKAP